MDLTKIVPKESSFKLRQAKDKIFTMNPINLTDEIWLSKQYGANIHDVFDKVDIKEISRIVFRLLKNEDKAFFKKQEVEIYNEEGDKEIISLGGVDLLRSLISGWGEKELILNALLENIGFSRPEVVESEENAETEDGKEKKSPNQ